MACVIVDYLERNRRLDVIPQALLRKYVLYAKKFVHPKSVSDQSPSRCPPLRVSLPEARVLLVDAVS